MTGCKSGVNAPPRDAKLEPPFPCDPLVLPPARRGDLIFLFLRSQLSRVVVAQPTCVHAATLPFLLIPCAYPLKLQSALRTVVSERRLCKVETIVSTREGIVRAQESVHIGFSCVYESVEIGFSCVIGSELQSMCCNLSCAKDPECGWELGSTDEQEICGGVERRCRRFAVPLKGVVVVLRRHY